MSSTLPCGEGHHQEARVRVNDPGLNVASLRIHLGKRESMSGLAPPGEGQREAQDPAAYPADFEQCKLLLGLKSTHSGGGWIAETVMG